MRLDAIQIFIRIYPECSKRFRANETGGRTEEVLLQGGERDVPIPVLSAYAVVSVLSDQHGQEADEDADAEIEPEMNHLLRIRCK